jgi:hypothetical protein
MTVEDDPRTWDEQRRRRWIEDYNAGRPVLLPWAEHESDMCNTCDVLRALMREAEEQQT